MSTVRVVAGLALRNLRRYLRRTLLTAAAMILGGALMVFSLTLGDGTHEAWIDSGVRTDTGHVTIETPQYRQSRKIEDRLSSRTRAEVEEALRHPGLADLVRTVSPKLTISGLASSAAGARPARIVGVTPQQESAFSTVDDQVQEGRYLEEGDRLAAYVGAGLVESLDLELGSRMVVTAQDAHQEIAGQLLRVIGIFRTGVPEIDQSLVHVPLSTAGEWLGSGDDVTNIGVIVENSDAVRPVTRRLEDALAGPIAEGKVSVLGWREAMPVLAAAVTIDDLGNYLIYGILFVIIALGIVNTVLMSVLHRHREFAVLQALGLTPGQTGTLVLIEGLVLTALSGLAGVALGTFVTWYFWGDGLDFSALIDEEMSFSGVVLDPLIIPRFRTTRFVQVLVFILSIGVLSALYPAFRAAKIDVTEAMKFER